MSYSDRINSVKSDIDALVTYANETTGGSDVSISDAVDSLVNGYGGSGSSDGNLKLIGTADFEYIAGSGNYASQNDELKSLHDKVLADYGVGYNGYKNYVYSVCLKETSEDLKSTSNYYLNSSENFQIREAYGNYFKIGYASNYHKFNGASLGVNQIWYESASHGVFPMVVDGSFGSKEFVVGELAIGMNPSTVSCVSGTYTLSIYRMNDTPNEI